MLVSYEEGQLVSYPGLPLVEALPSFHSFEMKTKPGDALTPTVRGPTAALSGIWR